MSENRAGTMSVAVDGYTVTSNSETAEDMIAALKSPKDESAEPRVVEPNGESKEEGTEGGDDARAALSKAAAELGKKGGEAKAAKRAEAKQDEKGPAPKEEKPLGKPRDDPRARLAQVTQQLAEERRYREQVETRLRQIEAGLKQPAGERSDPRAGQGEDPKRPDADEKPKEEDFESYADFVEARARWAAREEWSERQREAQLHERARTHTEGVISRVEGFNRRVAETAQTEPDFVGRIDPQLFQLQPSFTLEAGARPGPENVLADELIESEHPGRLLVHLSEHQEDLKRILSATSPREVAREVARAEARLAGTSPAPQPQSEKPEISRAKPPVRPVTASPPPTDDDIGDDLTYDEHVRRMNAREKRRR